MGLRYSLRPPLAMSGAETKSTVPLHRKRGLPAIPCGPQWARVGQVLKQEVGRFRGQVVGGVDPGGYRNSPGADRPGAANVPGRVPDDPYLVGLDVRPVPLVNQDQRISGDVV